MNSSSSSSSSQQTVGVNIPLVRFCCDVVLSFPLAVLGIFGNSLLHVVLRRHHTRFATDVLLHVLTFTDTMILISSVLLRSMRHVGWQAYDDAYCYIFVSLYPTVYVFRLVDIWITVIVVIERYVAVMSPEHTVRLDTPPRVYVIIGVTVVCAIVFSVPRFLEFSLTEVEPTARPGFKPTALALNKTYTVVYKIFIFSIVMYVVPMALLIGFNVKLFLAVNHAVHEMSAIPGRYARGLDTVSSCRQVTYIVLVFACCCITCNVVAMTAQVVWTLTMCFDKLRHLDTIRRILANVSNVFVTCNSTSNVLILLSLSRKFRDGICQTFSCRMMSSHTNHKAIVMEPLNL